MNGRSSPVLFELYRFQTVRVRVVPIPGGTVLYALQDRPQNVSVLFMFDPRPWETIIINILVISFIVL